MTESPDRAPRLSRRRAKRRSKAPVNLDRWMVSYADFVTLLFAFFTVLYAISKVDADKLSSMVGSMQQAFEATDAGVAPRRGTGRARAGQPPGSAKTAQGDPADVDVRARLEEGLSREVTDGRVSLEVDARGVVISVRESGSFPVGSADLTPEARAVLSTIAATIADIDHAVRVEGHTDDVPIHTARYASNWELSTARATSVVQYLIAAAGLPASRLSASGYGEFHPQTPNDSAENRTRNRRVDLIILNPMTRASEEPPATSSPSHAETPRDPRP